MLQLQRLERLPGVLEQGQPSRLYCLSRRQSSLLQRQQLPWLAWERRLWLQELHLVLERPPGWY